MSSIQLKFKEPPKRVKPRGKWRIWLAIGLIPVLLYLGLTLYVTYRYTTSYDRALGSETPASYGIGYYENVSFASAANDSLTLRGWWVPNPKGHRALILVHGQNGNRAGLIKLAKPLWDKGYSLLMFDLRGHGLSDGDHHTLGFYEQYDIVGAAHFLTGKGVLPESIGVIGWSMGAGTSVMAMSQTTDIRAGVIDSGYATERPLHHFEFVYPAVVLASKLLRGFDPEGIRPGEAATHLGNRHIFIIHGDKDTTIPLSEAEQLREAAGPNATEFWVVPGAGHTGNFDAQPEEYLRRVNAFFDRELS